MSTQNNQTPTAPVSPQNDTARFIVEKIYIKDVSFESPRAPHIFNGQNAFGLNTDLAQSVNRLDDTAYEVVLKMTLTCTTGGEQGNSVYVAEVGQAGVFTISGFEPEVLDALLGTQCPNILYPYARQYIDTLIQAGGFPVVALQPLNFDAIYAESLRQRQQQAVPEAPAGKNVAAEV